MERFVWLELRRNRGWPWPEESWGLTPMFGEDGWCRSCGVPRRAQSGSLVLQRRGFGAVEGAWVPNWQFDAICLEAALATAAAERFNLTLLPVAWHGTSPAEAMQIVVPSVGGAWFDPGELRDRTLARHSASGAACSECGVWRWLPLPYSELPPVRITPLPDDADIAASPDWFGDGWNAFRQILVRRELAELIVAASPRDFRVEEQHTA